MSKYVQHITTKSFNDSVGLSAQGGQPMNAGSAQTPSIFSAYGTANFLGLGNTTATSATMYVAPNSTTHSSGNYYYSYFAKPITTGSTTGSAYTLYIQDAPSGATSQYALYINNGSSYFGGQIISGVTTGTSPLSVLSTTTVANLSANYLGGNTFAIPGTIGSSVPNTGAFTTLSSSGLITGSGGLTISSGTSTLQAVTASGLITGNLGLTVATGQTTNLGTTGTTSPLNVYGLITANANLSLSGSTSGNITLQSQAVAGTYNFNLPNIAGTSGQVLTSGGGGTAPMAWTTPASGTGTVTSIALSVPSFLNVTGSPITSSGTLAVSYSGVALPVINGGTGTTTSTGTGSVVLNNTPTFITPVIGAATGTSLSVTGNINSRITTLTGSTSGIVTIQPQAVAGTYNFNIPNIAGTAGQFLTSGGGGSNVMYWTSPGGFSLAGNTTPSNATLYVSPNSTTVSGANNYYFSYYMTPTTSGTTTGAAYTMYIQGAPTGTITNPYALYINSGTSYFGGSLTTTGNINIATTIDGQAINPDAVNSLIVYEDESQTSVYSGTLAGSTTYLQNNYIQLTPNTNGISGQYYWNINPGNAFMVTFDAYIGGGSGADGLSFFWHCTAAPNTLTAYNSGLTNGYNLILQDYTGSKSPGISLWSNFSGTTTQLGSTYGNATTVNTSSFNTVTIIFLRNTIRVLFNGINIITYQDTTNRNQTSLNNYMGFTGFCGGLNNNHRVRNIRIAKTGEGLWQYSNPTSNTITSNASIINIPSTTASTSTTTGALVVGGGIGISGNSYFGSLNTSGVLNTSNNFIMNNNAIFLRAVGDTNHGIQFNSQNNGPRVFGDGGGSLGYGGQGGGVAVFWDSNGVTINGGLQLNGNLKAGNDFIMNSRSIFLKAAGDTNHGIQYNSNNDGPRIFGNVGGTLGYGGQGGGVALTWNSTGVNIPGNFSVNGTVGNILSCTSITASQGVNFNGSLIVNGNLGNGYSSYAYYTSTGSATSTGYTTTGVTTSISAANAVEGSQFNARSDRRIKKDIIDININGIDKILQSINPKKYNYIDKLQHSNKGHYGVIAQEINKILPEVVNTSTNFIPDIMKVAKMIGKNKFKLECDLGVGDIVKIYTSDMKKGSKETNIESKIIEKKDDIYTIELSDNKEKLLDVVFVYGKQVDDFHTVNYEQLIPLLVSGYQYQSTIIKSQKYRIDNLIEFIESKFPDFDQF
jgi:hypothetical protein